PAPRPLLSTSSRPLRRAVATHGSIRSNFSRAVGASTRQPDHDARPQLARSRAFAGQTADGAPLPDAVLAAPAAAVSKASMTRQKPGATSAHRIVSYPDDLIEHKSETRGAAMHSELTSVLAALEQHLRRDWVGGPPEQLHAELVALEQA